MKKRKLDKVFIWAMTLLFLLACLVPGAPLIPTQTVEVISQDALGTIVAGTSNAAQAQTSSALPTATQTFTLTWTPSVTSTFTPTFLYLLPTATLVPSETPIPAVGNLLVAGSGTAVKSIFTGRPWTCLVTGVSPAQNTVQKPNKEFNISWTLMNTGTKAWTNNGVDFVDNGGYGTIQRPIQDLPRIVASGSSISLTIRTLSPKRAGSFTIFWALQVGNNKFCTMKHTFVVEE